MDKAKTAALVTFFTILVWVFAEGESLQTKRTVAEVAFPALTGESYAVRVIEGQGWRGRVELQVEGSTASLDGLESELGRGVVLTPGMEGVPRESGEHTIDLRRALRGHPEFQSRGVTVLSAEPPTVRVVVEELTTVTLPIRVEAPGEELDGAAQVVGVAEAEVRLPRRVASQLSGGLSEGASVVARVRSEDLAPLQEGIRSTIQVRLEAGAALAGTRFLEIEPAQVDVQLTVRSKTETVVLPSVAVDLRLPPGELGRWDIEVPQGEQSLRDVRVTGPSDLIEQIRSGGLVVRAFVRLSFEDLEAGVSSKRAEFSAFPTALRFEVEDDEVQLVIRAREAGGDAGVEGGGPAG